MSLIRPFTALRPAPGRAADVIAPPYDVLSSAEARDRVAGRPWSFLHISKPEIDLPTDIDVHAPEVYAKGAANLRHMVDAGVLVRDRAPCYYVYRMTMGTHVQTGIVAGASVADYDTNRIRKHEHTRPDKEDDRVRQIEAVGGHTGPVLLAYPATPEVDALLAEAASSTPDADAVADDGIRHTLWVVRDIAVQARIGSAFDAMTALYIADGHHRSAAASRVAEARRRAGDGPDGESQRFLAVAFPHHEMRILPYNRVVRDLGRFSSTDFLAALEHDFDVRPEPAAVAPAQPREFGLHLAGGRWFRLRLRAGRVPVDDPVARLDVSLLATYALEPLLDIRDPRRDPRIDFVGGIRGLPELEKRVGSGEMAAAFSMHPTRLTDLMAVADAGLVMPPKSTWFEPKLADGMTNLMLD